MIFVEALPLDKIEIGDRTRKTYRNLDSLARSMKERGLLSPVNLQADGKTLLCGGRRIEAARSLGWTAISALVAESDLDEKEALLAEGDENTEREPFTPAEAVEHRRRIREVESRAAKERQRESGPASVAKRGTREDGSSNLEEPSPKPKRETETRHRTAKATGYSASTLDKVEEITDAAEDEAQPEPVREAARASVRNLEQPGAKTDREYKAFKSEVARSNPDVAAANFRKSLTQQLIKSGDLTSFDVDRIVDVADQSLLQTIDDTCTQIADWHQQLNRKRNGGLQVVNGGKQ